MGRAGKWVISAKAGVELMVAALTATQDMILKMADAPSETPSAQSKSLESVCSVPAATIWISN